MKIAAYFWTLFAGAFNDNFFKNALIIYIAFGAPGLAPDQRNLLVIIASAIFILPFFLFSASAGWLADARPKDWVIRLTKFAEVLIMLAGAVGFLTGEIGFLLIVLFLMGAQSAWFGPAKYGIVPELVREDQLFQANGLVTMGTFLAILGGTLAGGLASLESLKLVALVVVLVAILGYLASLGIKKLPAGAPGLKPGAWILKETFKRLSETRALGFFPLLLAISWFWFHGSFVLQLLPLEGIAASGEWLLPLDLSFLSSEAIGGRTVTLTLLLFSGGIGLGSLLAGTRPLARRGLRTSKDALFFLALLTGLLILLEGDSFVRYSVLVLTGLTAGVYSIPLYAAVQVRAKPGERARVFAAGNILDAGLMVLASLALQALDLTGLAPRERFLVLAGLDLGFLAFWVWPRLTGSKAGFVGFR